MRGRSASIFRAGLDYQASSHVFSKITTSLEQRLPSLSGMHEAAAVITYLSPGLRFFHQGQFENRKKRISPHLVRAPSEPIDAALRAFFARLLAVLKQSIFRKGVWRLLECVPAWDGNWSWDCFIAAL